MTVKPEETAIWQKYAAQTGRSDDLVIFGPDYPWRFNFLDYENRRTSEGGGQTENIVNLFSVILEVIEGKRGQDGGDSFWPRSVMSMLRNAVDIMSIARQQISVQSLMEFIANAPQSPAELAVREDENGDPIPTRWMNESPTSKTITAAEKRLDITPTQVRDLVTAATYWLKFWPTLADRTRTGIVATFTSMADLFAHGIAAELMTTETNITPEVTWQDGAVIVLALPVQSYMSLGLAIQAVWKYIFQRAVLRRDTDQWPRPVFIWQDEGQNFVNSYDPIFAQTSRSARACSVLLTQNINNIRAVMGQNGSTQADSLLGLSQTRIYHNNPDADTNKWAADTIGQDWMMVGNQGASFGQQHQGFNAGVAQQMHYRVHPVEFQRLRTGGPQNNYEVDAIVFRGNKPWKSTGDSVIRTVFKQR